MTTTSEAITYLKNTTATINGTKAEETTSTNNGASIDSQAFLNLMTMQLQYQDPTNPLDNSQMLAQEAQFATLEQMEALTSSFTNFSSAFQANSLMGQYVEVTTPSGDTEYGYVEYVNLNEKNGASVSVNGVLRPIDQVTKVFPTNGAAASDVSQNTSEINSKLGTIADSIANIAEKISKYIGKDMIEDVLDEITN